MNETGLSLSKMGLSFSKKSEDKERAENMFYGQHTIQIDKTLIAIGQAPSEAKGLVRKIYAALAEAEGQLIGAEKIDDTLIQATASSIQERAKEIEKILKEYWSEN